MEQRASSYKNVFGKEFIVFRSIQNMSLLVSGAETENDVEGSEKPWIVERTEIYDRSLVNLSLEIIDTEGLII